MRVVNQKVDLKQDKISTHLPLYCHHTGRRKTVMSKRTHFLIFHLQDKVALATYQTTM